ncbi:MAG: glycoside hydrolase, partial [Chloroflexi bacterium]|nr:glycoside hydrolase [Chloroflexota bacterium]
MSGGESAATFCNPFWRGSFPDPFVLKVRGRYYAYGTEQQERPEAGARIFPILTSSDLVHWQEAGRALQPLGTQYFRYWAPEVAAHNGKFLLYYAVHTDEFTAGIRVATADVPAGPFVDSGHDLTRALFPWAIDPHVFCDHDGQWYLYMTVELRDDPSALTGVGNVVVRLRDPYTVEGSPSVVTPPRHAWQLFEARRLERAGIDWYCVEGPTVLRHRRRYHEMFSGGCYYRDNYAVSYAVADTPMGPSNSRDTSWQEAMGPDGPRFLLQGRSGAISPGHNSVVYGPNNADLYLAYHTLSPERTERRPCLDRLFWHGDEPWTAGPTDTQQPAPALPRWRDLYEHTQSTLSPSWTPDGGAWRAQDGIVVQDDRYARLALLHQQEVLGSAWLLEVNLRRLMGIGRYGLELRACDHALARITIEPTSELTVWSGESCVEQLSAAALPAGFAADDWHQLMCTFAGSVLGLQIDGRPLSEVVLAGSPRTIALLTEDCQAAFSGLSLTDHFRD